MKQVDVVLLLKIQAPCSYNYHALKELTICIFVINELFCNSPIMLLCIAKEALFNQTVLNK